MFCFFFAFLHSGVMDLLPWAMIKKLCFPPSSSVCLLEIFLFPEMHRLCLLSVLFHLLFTNQLSRRKVRKTRSNTIEGASDYKIDAVVRLHTSLLYKL